ncbi:hypothetical protein C0993_010374 [Termitomyces sp. T159_Od127]|nr:hypothetical protein C0993_010374 [Termitomyces sp. T159_Od127]
MLTTSPQACARRYISTPFATTWVLSALPTHQGKEEEESSKSKQKASWPLLSKEKRKKRAWIATSKVESEDGEEKGDKEAHHLAEAIEASKAVPSSEGLAGPSQQAEALQDVGMQQEDNGQGDCIKDT